MDTEKLAAAFVGLADTLVDDFDVIELLHVLTTRCVDLIGATAAGLLLAENGDDLRVVVATSERTQLLELFQIQNDEGPCLECYRTGEPVASAGLAEAESRWPSFAPAALAEGFVSVVALPMRLRGQVIGALNLFGAVDSPAVSDRLVPVAQAMADVATIAILQDRLARGRGLLNAQLQVALDSRVAIEQAKGALATRLDIGTDEAFELLRKHARATRRRLSDVAEEVTAGNWQAVASCR